VWEWVDDCWHEDYNGAPADGSAWREEDGGNRGARVIRGGSWVSFPEGLRSSVRNWYSIGLQNFDIGFRLAQDLD
jgi:formylglycine-generating enzyme required for sulfatase activity